MTYFLNNISYSKEELICFSERMILSSNVWEVELYSFILQWFDENDYVVGYTSGTTGVPKRMLLLKERMKISAARTIEYLDIYKNSTALLCLSVSYIAGKMMVVRALEFGLNLICIEPSMESLLQLDKQIDFAALVPYQLSELIDKNHVVLDNIKTLIIGGAEVSKQLIDKLQNVSTVCYATYGMTETLSHIALKRLNGSNPDKYYYVLKGIEIGQDERSCLQVRAYDREILTTNDIVKICSSNTFEWLGRYDNIINSGGIKFVPEQIEEKIRHLIGMRFIISSKSDLKLGRRMVLIIEGEEFDTSVLFNELNSVLSKYEIPKEISFVEKFNETSSGKIIRIN